MTIDSIHCHVNVFACDVLVGLTLGSDLAVFVRCLPDQIKGRFVVG